MQDIRYALRNLWHSKAFAVVAVLCLGLGIGLNTTIFSVVDGVLLKPFPYSDPDRIVVLNGTNQKAGIGQSGLSFLDVRDTKAAARSFTTMASSQSRSLTISDGGEPERYVGAMVSWDLFPLLGTSPILGHGFAEADDRPGGGGVALLSYAIWTTRYHNDPNVLGRRMLVNGAPTVIVGVMPPEFEFPNNQKIWLPLAPTASTDPRNSRGLFTFARLAPGVSMEQASAEVTGLSGRLATEFPTTNENWGMTIRTLRETFIPPNVSQVIWLMMAGVTLVLLIAGSNVANLLLARASARQREISVRAALGAGRGRIIRQLITESVVLSLVSLPLGILLAEGGTRLIAADMPPDSVPYYIHWTVDSRSLLYSMAVAVVTAVIFGLFPAVQATRGNLHSTLKEGTRGNSARRSLLRSGLVIAQVALALVALVGALLFVRSFSNMDDYNFGFDVKPLMAMRFYLPGDAYAQADAKLRRVEDIVERVEALPGVQAAFSSNYVPLSGGGGGGAIVVEGQPVLKGPEAQITLIGTTAHFAKVMGLPVRGRDFTESEGFGHLPVALVSQSMARRFWPSTEAIGGRFHLASDSGEAADWYTVIGVVGDAKLYGVDPSNDQPQTVAYVPYGYQQTLNTGLTVRVSGDPGSISTPARAAIRASDPNLAVFQVRSVDDLRRLSYWQYGLYGWIFGTIGVVGLLLASVGVYGVLSYSVSQRTQEIGVRIALGAGRRQVLRLVVGYGLLLAGIGIGLGLVLAPAATMAARGLLFRVSPFDPVSFAGVAALLLAVAFFASYIPALRATRVDPVTALRGEN